MQKLLLFIVSFCLIPALSYARDHIVKFQEEYYREQQADSAQKLYHAIQVNSSSGSKLLILTGDNEQYRIWLRDYLVNYKTLIVSVPNKEDDNFRRSFSFKINITNIHPIDWKKWKENPSGPDSIPVFMGQKHILIVDTNAKRRKLQKLIVNNLGYPVTLASNGLDALKMFRMQPDKFSMVITENSIPGMSGTDLIKQLIREKPGLPIILGVDYKNRNKFYNKSLNLLAGSDKILIKTPVLKELSKSIVKLLGIKS